MLHTEAIKVVLKLTRFLGSKNQIVTTIIIHKALRGLWKKINWVNFWSRRVEDFTQHEDVLDLNVVPYQKNLGRVQVLNYAYV
jgi:hypothetical protein